MFVNHKHKKVPRHHHWSTDHASLSVILLSIISDHGKKRKRGFKFTIAELEHLFDVIDEVLTIGNPDWEKVCHVHSNAYPTIEWTPESLKCRFQELVCDKIPTGDPNCPPYICEAKQISWKIVLATNGSTGGSDGEVESIANNGDEENENGMDEEEGNDAEVPRRR
jgi:hypothetical protein